MIRCIQISQIEEAELSKLLLDGGYCELEDEPPSHISRLIEECSSSGANIYMFKDNTPISVSRQCVVKDAQLIPSQNGDYNFVKNVLKHLR